MTSAYTPEQWRQLEDIIFDGSSAQLEAIRDYARANQLPPIALLVMCALRVLASLPAGTPLKTGFMPPGVSNMIVMLIGYPGAGKDRTQQAASEIVTVTIGDNIVAPKELTPGSGEGIETALAAIQDDSGLPGLSTPVLFGDSEGTGLAAKMKRESSTLRSNLLKLYSGNAMGTANKKDTVTVPARSYTACLWSCAQWDTAHVFLHGDDDGLKHRIMWIEVLDPDATLGNSSTPPTLHPVALPASIGHAGIAYCGDALADVAQQGIDGLKGRATTGSGHALYTRCKLAAGLALLSSRTDVTQTDWEKAGALIDFSTAIEKKISKLADEAEIMKETEALERKESAKTQLYINRQYRAERLVLSLLKDSESFGHRTLHDKGRRYRRQASDVISEFADVGIITIDLDSTGKPYSYHRGPAWDTERAGERIAYLSQQLPH